VTHTRRWVSTLATAVFAVTALAAPQQAMAVGGTTLYVDNLSSACTDSGAGTQAAPFCTIQAAANAATAGDTVLIYGSAGTESFAGTPGDAYAGGITISQSGTAAAPIVFEAANGPYEVTGGTNSFKVTGDYVEISGAQVREPAIDAFWMGGTHDVLDGDQAESQQPPVYVGGGSDLTVERSFLTSFDNTVVSFANGGSGSVVTTNTLIADQATGPKSYAVLVDAVSGVDITSNTISIAGGCGVAIGVVNSSSDVAVENNVVSYGNCSASTPQAADLAVFAPSTSSTTVGYNVFPGGTSLVPYDWSGTEYATPAALTAATGQGTADSTDWPTLTTGAKPTTGAAVGSANASAPGELSTDIYGNPWSGTPNRGAVSNSDVTTATLYTTVPTAQQATATLDLQGIPWSPAATFTLSWGDGGDSGVASTLNAVSQTTDFSDYLNYSHMYTRPGTYTITATLKDTAQTITRTASVTMTGSTYVPVTPIRILDTRKGLGAAKAMVGPSKTLAISVTNGVTVPAGIGAISAVVMNVTVTNPTAGGNITVYPDGGSEPATSNVNFSTQETVPNLVTVKVSADSKVELTNNSPGSTDLVADVAGYYVSATSGDLYLPDTPNRLLDTRNGTGGIKGAIAANATVSLAMPNCTQNTTSGEVSVPASAVALNVTVTTPSSGGFITAYPDKTTLPNASNVNYSKNETVPNMVVVKVGSDGKVAFHNSSPGTAQLIVDLEGCYSTAVGSVFVPLNPVRVLDTRNGTGQVQASQPAGWNDVSWDQENGPAGDALLTDTGLVLNVTVTQPQAGGYLTVYPGLGGTPPTASNLNFSPGETVPNLVMVSVDWAGHIALYNGSSAPTQVIADLFGYFA
jgi:hypothetical protein